MLYYFPTFIVVWPYTSHIWCSGASNDLFFFLKWIYIHPCIHLPGNEVLDKKPYRSMLWKPLKDQPLKVLIHRHPCPLGRSFWLLHHARRNCDPWRKNRGEGEYPIEMLATAPLLLSHLLHDSGWSSLYQFHMDQFRIPLWSIIHPHPANRILSHGRWNA